MKLLLLYLLIINAAGFLVMTADKLFAKRNAWRVPEKRLLGIAAIGGSIGVWLAMYTIRHKTHKPKFFIGVPLILLCQIALLLYVVLQ